MKSAKNSSPLNQTFSKLPIVLGISLTIPVTAVHATIVQPDEIVVTARRMNEEAQNVPISLTVFNQEMLDERNVVNAADLAAFTPSLSVNSQFGAEQSSFAIRGFSQEFRTTASVAVYFADVVAPRGSGAITAGDGAGPGSFFDLKNVQVLKGPQGTLFGRNTTGGAIQLVPQEPTHKLEGFFEQSFGNYDMRRSQGVFNMPLGDRARARFGVDTQKRDGYIKNISGIGESHMANVNYIAGRASLVLDLSDSLQNYTVASYTNSQNNGIIAGRFKCEPTVGLGIFFSCPPPAQQESFYEVASDRDNSYSKLKQWQVINTTTWNVSDDFSIKNIISYADLEVRSANSVFGSNFKLTPVSSTYGVVGTPVSFYPAGEWHGIPSSSQTTFTEEIQFSGNAFDNSLTWQAGLYYENSRPDGFSGALSGSTISCGIGDLSSNPNDWLCSDALSPATGGQLRGSVQSSIGKTEYLNQAIYSQATYNFSEEYRLTVGARYTSDESKGDSQSILFYNFPTVFNGGPAGPGSQTCIVTGADPSNCRAKSREKSEAPTWMIGFDYLPTKDVMIYAKYTRGYRQGNVNIYAPDGMQSYEPEEVDAFELGAKTSFQGIVAGTFNMALFYNELNDQQIQVAYVPESLGTPTTAIANAGKSTIQGVEAETTLKLTENLGLNLAYTYLETHVDSLEVPPPPSGGIIHFPDEPSSVLPSTVEGAHLAFSPRHNATLGLSYRLPLPQEIGDISIGGSFTHTSDQVAQARKKYGTLDERNVLNLNASWKAIMGSAFDAGLFVTNATDEEISVYVPGLYERAGMEFRTVAPPRMYGARVKYTFGL